MILTKDAGIWILSTTGAEFSKGQHLPALEVSQNQSPSLGPERPGDPCARRSRAQSTLASHSAVPRGTNVKRMHANRAIRIAAQRTLGLRRLTSVFGGRYDRQRTLAIRIAAITLASDSVIAFARFRPSKLSSLSTFSSSCARWLIVNLPKPTPRQNKTNKEGRVRRNRVEEQRTSKNNNNKEEERNQNTKQERQRSDYL